MWEVQSCSRELVYQPFMTSYVIIVYLWPSCTPKPRNTSTWCSAPDWWIPTKVERQWPAGEDRRAALATSGSTMSSKMRTLYRCLLGEDLWDRQESRNSATVHSDYATTMTVMMRCTWCHCHYVLFVVFVVRTLPILESPYPMLVLVGPQGVAKKTLAQKLAEDLPDYFGYAWV